jgi:hypothetical protein
MLSSVAIESTFHHVQSGKNGTVQVSAAKDSIGLLVQRNDGETGLLLSIDQAQALAGAISFASSVYGVRQLKGEAPKP